MKTLFKSTFFNFSLLILSALLLLSVLVTPIASVRAEIILDTPSMTVTTQNHENTTIKPSSFETPLITYNGNTSSYKVQKYNWDSTRNFVIRRGDEIADLGSDALYEYKYTVSWTPSVAKDGSLNFDADHAQKSKVLLSGSTKNKNEIPKGVEFAVDANKYTTKNDFAIIKGQDVLTDGDNYITQGGWGTYIFSFECTGQTIQNSEALELTPTAISSLQKPVVTYTVASSATSIKNAYHFAVDETYKFVDRSKIKWYVFGQAKDGRIYVLDPSDVKDPAKENTIYPTEAVSRKGLEFRFDPGIEGNWTITCKVTNEEIAVVYESDPVSISTVKGLSTSAIIGIVVAAAAAASIIVAVVIVVSIKKERVY